MVKVKFFANFREVAGLRETDIDASNIRELLNLIIERFQNLKPLIFENGELRDYVHIMVNGRHINHLDGLDTKLKKDDTVAIFPPVSGG